MFAEAALAIEFLPGAVVLVVGLIVLVRRRGSLGRAGTVAIVAVAGMLVAGAADLVTAYVYFGQAKDGYLNLPWWIDPLHRVMLPADLLALPMLAWAILARRRLPRVEPLPAAEVPS